MGVSGSLVRPEPTMDRVAELEFWTGFALFRDPWVAAPSSTQARDGLGPLFSARSCIACHEHGGRGDSLIADTETASTVFRLVEDPQLNARFGRQIQHRAIYDVNETGRGFGGFFQGEPRPTIEIEEVSLAIPGNWTLKRIHARLPNAPEYAVSPRVAPSLFGLGLLEAIPDARLVALSDPDDRNNDGISGRVNWVGTGDKLRAGRFGWKAPHATVAEQTADAFRHDIGITNRFQPSQDCAALQLGCQQQTSGDGPQGPHEINGILFDATVNFTASIAVPDARTLTEAVRRGQRLFNDTGCASCHTPAHSIRVDGETQTIWPYTDLLLHDMGPLLADAVVEGVAHGSEWRTPPLWGLGLAQHFNRDTGLLHDGRAATVAEAVLWHGGEAAESARQFLALDRDEQHALEAFVHAL
ncbi:MAG: di-heme oxidoredictase family protein [Pseudomonadota bacterium]